MYSNPLPNYVSILFHALSNNWRVAGCSVASLSGAGGGGHRKLICQCSVFAGMASSCCAHLFNCTERTAQVFVVCHALN